MCLLSYYPSSKSGDGPVLTSNRDISIRRPTADSIKEYEYKGKTVAFPRDYKGGSWMAYDRSRMIFLLNGHKINHHSRDNYARSRGLVLLDLFIAPDVLATWESSFDLDGIEPFTIVYVTADGLYELGWDENRKYTTSLSTKEAHMWMSSTLYTEEDKQRIQKEFQNIKNPTSMDLMDFNEKNNYAAIKLPIDKIEVVETVCTYQLLKAENRIRHLELIHQ